jgi:hypothetical protein
MNMDTPDEASSRSPNGFVPFEHMSPVEAQRMRDLIARAAADDAREIRPRKPAPRYGIAASMFPAGVAAVVIRPERGDGPVVVFSPESVDDDALALADAALARDRLAVPDPSGVRVLHVARDGSVDVRAHERASERFQLDIVLHRPGGRDLTAPLVRAAGRAASIHVEGFGQVRFPEN